MITAIAVLLFFGGLSSGWVVGYCQALNDNTRKVQK